MANQRHHFDLLADYFQFYLQDDPADGNLGDSWTPEAVERLLATTAGTVGIGTVRNMRVPVDVVVSDGPPIDSADEWDHVVECSIDVPSGQIVVAGCTDYFADAARLQVPPGTYRLRAHYGGLNSVSKDGLSGSDHYSIVLWPGTATDPVVLKARQPGGR